MKNMRFDVDCVRNCLVSKKVVYSVRSYKYFEDKCLFNGRVYGRSLIGIIECKEDLVEFVECSGFDNVDDWYEKIVDFCKDNVKYLYIIFLSSQLDELERSV